MANIEHLLDDIRKNKYCVDMKETFCNALNEANANAEEIESNVKKIKDEIISINANAEIIDARCGEENLGDFNRKLSSQLDNITITMPPPSTVDINTKNLQNILDKAKGKNINLTVQFLGGYYELYTCIIYDNTTIKMCSNTTLKNKLTSFTNSNTSESINVNILFMNAKPLDNEDFGHIFPAEYIAGSAAPPPPHHNKSHDE